MTPAPTTDALASRTRANVRNTNIPRAPRGECSYYEHLAGRLAGPEGSLPRSAWQAVAVPLLLFAWPGLLLRVAPDWEQGLVLDRGAVGAGEFWRLVTGHWVHFSASHLGWNLLVLLAAGAWLQRLRPGLLLRHILIAAPLVGLAVLLGEPHLERYGGLSGLAAGVVVLLGLHQARAAGTNRPLWLGVLALVAIKCVADFMGTGPQFARYQGLDIVTSATAHAAGAVIAVVHYGLSQWVGGERRSTCTPAHPHAKDLLVTHRAGANRIERHRHRVGDPR